MNRLLSSPFADLRSWRLPPIWTAFLLITLSSCNLSVTGTSPATGLPSCSQGGLAAPIPISPTYNPVAIDTLSPVFSWTYSGLCLPDHYRVEVSKHSDFESPVLTGTAAGNSWTAASPLQPVTGYYWRVAANRGSNTGPYSEVLTFHTGPHCVSWGFDGADVLLQAPVLLSPMDGETIHTLRPVFRWNDPTSFSCVPWGEYSVEVSLSPDFPMDPAFSQGTSSDMLPDAQLWNDLKKCTQYYWKVWLHLDAFGESPVSSTFTFRTNVEGIICPLDLGPLHTIPPAESMLHFPDTPTPTRTALPLPTQTTRPSPTTGYPPTPTQMPPSPTICPPTHFCPR